jgi:predicted TIM-barrel fold metal-dependent hydrolase
VANLPVPIVFDHMGGVPAGTDRNDHILKGILNLLEKGRSWVKLTGYRNSIAGHPYADVKPLAQAFVEAVSDRCVWGSDWPHTNISGYMPDDGDLLDLLADWVPNAETRKRILVDNPARLYRF